MEEKDLHDLAVIWTRTEAVYAARPYRARPPATYTIDARRTSCATLRRSSSKALSSRCSMRSVRVLFQNRDNLKQNTAQIVPAPHCVARPALVAVRVDFWRGIAWFAHYRLKTIDSEFK